MRVDIYRGVGFAYALCVSKLTRRRMVVLHLTQLLMHHKKYCQDAPKPNSWYVSSHLLLFLKGVVKRLHERGLLTNYYIIVSVSPCLFDVLVHLLYLNR
jgi:hypothetical protein